MNAREMFKKLGILLCLTKYRLQNLNLTNV